eukprot:scaffold2209_cov168-Amphora_coffeaeformis.AAC.8
MPLLRTRKSTHLLTSTIPPNSITGLTFATVPLFKWKDTATRSNALAQILTDLINLSPDYRTDPATMDHYNRLIQYKLEGGDINTIGSNQTLIPGPEGKLVLDTRVVRGEGKYLMDGWWLYSQISTRTRGETSARQISERQCALLDTLGLDWNREYNNSHHLEDQPVEDNQNYQDLKAFYEAGGDINTVTKRSSLKMSNDGTWELVRDASATDTGAWLCDQRKFYRTGRMKESRVQGLEAIGIIWELEKPVPSRQSRKPGNGGGFASK